jgi:hypothetical protein
MAMSAENGDLLDRSLDEVLDALAGELLGEGLGFGPEERRSRRQYAKEWFDEHLDDFRERLCSDEDVRLALTGSRKELFIAASTVIDSAGTAVSGKPVTTLVATLVVIYGYATICQRYLE